MWYTRASRLYGENSFNSINNNENYSKVSTKPYEWDVIVIIELPHIFARSKRVYYSKCIGLEQEHIHYI